MASLENLPNSDDGEALDDDEALNDFAELLYHLYRVNCRKKDFLISLNDIILKSLPPNHPLLQSLGIPGFRRLYKPVSLKPLYRALLALRSHDTTQPGRSARKKPDHELWRLEELEQFESSQGGPTTEQLEAAALFHSFAQRSVRQRRTAGIARVEATNSYLQRIAGAAGEDTFRAMHRLASRYHQILGKAKDIAAASEEWNRPYQNNRRNRLRQRVYSLLYDFTAVVEASFPTPPPSGTEASDLMGRSFSAMKEETLQVVQGLLEGSRDFRDGLLWSF